MPPVAHLRHATAGRARLKVASRRGQAGYFSQVEQRLARLPGVRNVAVNHRTGSVLVHHTMAVEELIAFAEREGLFEVSVPGRRGAGGPPLPESFTNQLDALDRLLRGLTGDGVDLRTLGAVTLLGLGVVQALRGNIAGPATTLFWYAVTLLMVSPPGGSANGMTEA